MIEAVEAILASARKIGPTLIVPPMLQPARLYLELVGDAIRTRAFMIEEDESERRCLRPDMTAAAVAEALSSHRWSNAFGVHYDGTVFRRTGDAEEASEFRQIGAERFAPKAEVEASEPEIILAAVGACESAGAPGRLRLGDIGVFSAFVDACGLPDPHARRLKRAFARPGGLGVALQIQSEETEPGSPLAEALAALSTESARGAVAAMLAEGRLTVMAGRSVEDVAARLQEKGRAGALSPIPPKTLDLLRAVTRAEGPPDTVLAELSNLAKKASVRSGVEPAVERAAERWRAIRAQAPDAVFSAGFGRGLAYYDGFQFDIVSPKTSKILGGGGRYDALLERLAAGKGKTAVAGWGAAGFALRPARISEAVR